VDPSRYPTTTPGTATTPAASGFTGNGYANPNSALMQSLNGKPPAPTGGTLPRQEPGKPPAPTPTGGLPPGTLPRQGGSPGTQTSTPSQPGTPGQTPATPGTTTASRPGGAWPTEKLGPFGTDDGGSSMFPPGFPFNDRQRPGQPGGALDLSGLSQSIQARVAEAIGGNPAQRQAPAAGITPIPGLEGLGDRIRAVVEQGQRDIQSRMPQPGGLPQPGGPGGLPQPGGTTPGGTTPGGTLPRQTPGPTTGGASANALGVADMIILQESGGAPATPNNLNCSIRPNAGCLDLNTGIFEVTAREYGLDWDRLVAGDAEYGRQAVAGLMTGYAQDDASKWNGPSGMTVWEYGEQNLPGGGWEAVGRVYFGGDVTGSFVDEQGRSGVTYGQQFVDKLNNAGINTAPGQAMPGTETPQGSPIPVDAVPGPGGPGAEGPVHGPIATGDFADQGWMQTALPGGNVTVSSPYMAPVTWDADYSYQVGHGADAQHHAAYDLAVPENTPVVLNDTLSGQVVCGGMPGTNPCAAYGSDRGGPGGIEVLLDNQGNNTISMVYGHLNSGNVTPGQQVGPGTQLGLSGTAGTGPHVHLEARAYCPGQGYTDDWKFIDPGMVINGYYQTHDACRG
jgi:murein DD-endopeptidase MepM/ murein hydrolase activator NlpD